MMIKQDFGAIFRTIEAPTCPISFWCLEGGSRSGADVRENKGFNDNGTPRPQSNNTFAGLTALATVGVPPPALTGFVLFELFGFR
jgi:hypothetical protein